MCTLDDFLNFNISTTLSVFAKATNGHGANMLIQNGLLQRRTGRKIETNILGIRISIFLGCIFWRDFKFCSQEGFREECGQKIFLQKKELRMTMFCHKKLEINYLRTKINHSHIFLPMWLLIIFHHSTCSNEH